MHDSAYRNVEILVLVSRGTGRQASLMWSNLAGFWGVGMPVCYLMAFKYRLGVEGLWIGLLTGLSCSGQQSFEPHYARLATARIICSQSLIITHQSCLCMMNSSLTRSSLQTRCLPTLAQAPPHLSDTP